jgi:hypothetical protein
LEYGSRKVAARLDTTLVVLGILAHSATESWNNVTCSSVLIALSFRPPVAIKEPLAYFSEIDIGLFYLNTSTSNYT